MNYLCDRIEIIEWEIKKKFPASRWIQMNVI